MIAVQTCAQVLLSLGNLASRMQYLNASNTFTELFSYGTVPIVNENDTVAVEELRIGDNDTLSAQASSGSLLCTLLHHVARRCPASLTAVTLCIHRCQGQHVLITLHIRASGRLWPTVRSPGEGMMLSPVLACRWQPW